MDTRKLFYEDCHTEGFTATVTGCTGTDKGYAVTLDATAFYPEGGGQASDLGTLNGIRVLDVREKDEQILHLCQEPLTVGTQVTGRIDWERRFDLMQQHTGEHILSGLIHARFGYHNVGFHVGKQTVEIDFDGPIPPDALRELEEAANEAVWRNLEVACWYPSPEELPGVTYRSKRALPWPVRIVQVPGYDSCACCGVHVKRTGEVGLIKILSAVKFHQGVRLEMVCGRRAYRYLDRVYEQNRQVSQMLSARIPETAEAARRMTEQLAAEKFRAGQLERRVFGYVAGQYAGKGNTVCFEDGLSSSGVRELADAIAQTCGGIAAVFSGTDEAGYQMCLIGKGLDVKPLGTALCKTLNGRGGGKPGSFQGSAKAAREQIRAFLEGYGDICFYCQ